MPSVTMYQIPQVIQLTDAMGISVGTVMNRTDFNLFKNVTNSVEFLIKTVDRKPMNLANVKVILYLIDDANNQIVIKRDLLTIDNAKGWVRLMMGPNDILNLTPGYFRYSIVTENSTGQQVVVFTDQNRSVKGMVQVLSGPLPEPQKSIEITDDDFVSQRWGNPQITYRVSQTYQGSAQRDNKSGHHTFAIYCQNFTGSIHVEASLENFPPSSDGDWFTAKPLSTVHNYSGIKMIQFTGNYMWLRFYYQPAVGNQGTILRALLKS